MFKKVSTEEIKEIKGRLKSELKNGNLTFQRKEEVKSLICYLDKWLEEIAYRDIFLGTNGIGAIPWSD